MKVRVWVVSTTIPEPGEGPCLPTVFGSEAEAEAYADKILRDEWNAAEIIDDAGARLAYPDDWRQAQDRIVAFFSDGSWGTWEITSHDVEIGNLPDSASPPLRTAP